MDHAQEVTLIENLDADVRRLLERCDDLMRAGDDRPLLTMVGRQLHSRLRGVAELSGSLAALVSNDRAGDSRGGASAMSGRPAPDATSTPRAPRGSAALPRTRGHRAGEADPSMRERAPVIRLKPRMPRRAWRGRGVGAVSKRQPVLPEAASSVAAGQADRAPFEVAAPEPVYRLRKARASEAAPPASVAGAGGAALDRLADFFKR